MYVKVNGLPGYGSKGLDGSIGKNGSSIRFYDGSTKNLSATDIGDLLYDYLNHKFEYVKNITNTGSLDLKKINDNTLNIFKGDKNIYCEYPIILSDNIKTQRQVSDTFEDLSFLNISSSDGSIININNSLLLTYDTSSGYYDCSCFEPININNLYVSGNTNIISYEYGYDNIESIIKSITYIIDNDYYNWKINYENGNSNDLYSLSCIVFDKNGLNGIEHLIKDYDSNEILLPTEGIKIDANHSYKLKLNYIRNNNLVETIFDLNTYSELKIKHITINDASSNNNISNNFNIEFFNNNITISANSSTDDTIKTIKCYITFDGNIEQYSNCEKDKDNDDTCYITIDGSIDNLTNFIINGYKYTLNYKSYKAGEDSGGTDNILPTIEDYTDRLAELSQSGVPCSNFIEQYIIKNVEDVDISIKFSEFSNDCSLNIYFKLNDIDNYKFDCSSIVDPSLYCGCITDTTMSNEDISTSVQSIIGDKLLTIYYEYLTEPEYAICTTSLSGSFGNYTKKTLLIPWEISAFDSSSLMSLTKFDLRAYNSITRSRGIVPENLNTLSIIPNRISNLDNMLYTTNKYPLKYKPIIDDVLFMTNAKGVDGYYMDGFLKFFYNVKDTATTKTYVYLKTSETRGTFSGSTQYTQVLNEYPIWNKVSFDNIKINSNNDTYYKLNIAPVSSGVTTAPSNGNGILLDGITTETYINYNDASIGLKSGFLGGIKWSIRKFNGEYTEDYEFSDLLNITSSINTDTDKEYKTLYSLYWNINPRYVKAIEYETEYDRVINVLKQPKVMSTNNTFLTSQKDGIINRNFLKSGKIITKLVQYTNTTDKTYDGTNLPAINGDTIITDINTNGKLDFVQTVDPNLR